MEGKEIKRFPLTVTQDWLDRVEQARRKDESKHEFILKSVDNEFKFRRSGADILREDE